MFVLCIRFLYTLIGFFLSFILPVSKLESKASAFSSTGSPQDGVSTYFSMESLYPDIMSRTDDPLMFSNSAPAVELLACAVHNGINTVTVCIEGLSGGILVSHPKQLKQELTASFGAMGCFMSVSVTKAESCYSLLLIQRWHTWPLTLIHCSKFRFVLHYYMKKLLHGFCCTIFQQLCLA